MVNKPKKSTSGGRVKVGKMRLNKETVKDLSSAEKKLVKGGQMPTGYTKQSACNNECC
jgi:hypothetical protein